MGTDGKEGSNNALKCRCRVMTTTHPGSGLLRRELCPLRGVGDRVTPIFLGVFLLGANDLPATLHAC
jgi:hypothetical protein